MLQLWHHPPTHTPLPLRAPMTPPPPRHISLMSHLTRVDAPPSDCACNCRALLLSARRGDRGGGGGDRVLDGAMQGVSSITQPHSPHMPHSHSSHISPTRVFSSMPRTMRRQHAPRQRTRRYGRSSTCKRQVSHCKSHTASLTLQVSHCMSHTAFLPPLVCSIPNSMCLILTMTCYYHYYSDHDRRL